MSDPAEICRYELVLLETDQLAPESAKEAASKSFPAHLLAENALWFCRLRWIVVGIFVAFGLTGSFPEALRNLGMHPRTGWAFVVAAILALGNLVFLAHARLLERSSTTARAATNLWAQIVLDLLILTVVVHNLGSLETFAPLTYLLHIVLACIFFSRAQSFAVTATGGIFYAACVVLETKGILSTSSIYLDATLRTHMHRTAVALNVLSALVIFAAVWFLASRLSALVRERDYELAEKNRQLEKTQEERTRHMLRTTHELKAPFAAVHANTQVLLKGHCGPLSDDAATVVRRISERCRRLGTEIQEMLQLANLRSVSAESIEWADVDLGEVLDWCVGQVRQTAQERGVTIEYEVQAARVVGVEDHLKMLFSNLLANAVVYSHEGGCVRVQCTEGKAQTGPLVTIRDHGIGIPREKVRHIFDEYYRTDEAVRHNKESTGLGLAIARHVAKTHRIRVEVETAVGTGTKFALRLPATHEMAECVKRKE
jgi:signal transduction histidine kinase